MSQLTVFVLCLRNVQAGKQLHTPGAELNLTEGDAAELLKLGAVELIEQPPEVAGLLGCDHLPALVIIRDRELQAGDIVREAFEKSGLTVEGWNALNNVTRQVLVDELIAGLQVDDQGEPIAPQSGVDAQQSSETVGAEPSQSPSAESDLPAEGAGADAATEGVAAPSEITAQATTTTKRKK